MELDNYTPKQIEVLESFAIDNPKILICSGAKRAGKTFIFTISIIKIWAIDFLLLFLFCFSMYVFLGSNC